jgi:ABC-type uncharacterized transport system substrate-binding protein
VRCHAVAMIAWLLAAMLTAPLAAEAQSRIPSIGVLMPGPIAQRLHMLEALRQGLREQGYVEGQNSTLVVRSADGVMERLPALAEELVRHPVDIILAPGVAANAAKQVTSTTPIVIAVGDALAMGLVTNWRGPAATSPAYPSSVRRSSRNGCNCSSRLRQPSREWRYSSIQATPPSRSSSELFRRRPAR